MSLPNLRSTVFLFVLLATAALAGCTPSIGDKCVLSTDCSLAGDRLCDTSQVGGYCTIFNCTPNSCPDYAACVLFNEGVQGCGYDDRRFGRTARSFCMAGCKSSSDCRQGYVCRDVQQPPWSALLTDDNQGQTVCILDPDPALLNVGSLKNQEAGVCQENPDVDAALPPLPDAGRGPVDAGLVDAGLADAGLGDAGLVDAGLVDATLSDAGGADAKKD